MGDNPPPGVNLKHTVFHYEKSMNTYQPNKLIQANKKPNKSKRTSGWEDEEEDMKIGGNIENKRGNFGTESKPPEQPVSRPQGGFGFAQPKPAPIPSVPAPSVHVPPKTVTRPTIPLKSEKDKLEEKMAEIRKKEEESSNEYERRIVTDYVQPGGARIKFNKLELEEFLHKIQYFKKELVSITLSTLLTTNANGISDQFCQTRAIKAIYLIEGILEKKQQYYINSFMKINEDLQRYLSIPRLVTVIPSIKRILQIFAGESPEKPRNVPQTQSIISKEVLNNLLIEEDEIESRSGLGDILGLGEGETENAINTGNIVNENNKEMNMFSAMKIQQVREENPAPKSELGVLIPNSMGNLLLIDKDEESPPSQPSTTIKETGGFGFAKREEQEKGKIDNLQKSLMGMYIGESEATTTPHQNYMGGMNIQGMNPLNPVGMYPGHMNPNMMNPNMMNPNMMNPNMMNPLYMQRGQYGNMGAVYPNQGMGINQLPTPNMNIPTYQQHPHALISQPPPPIFQPLPTKLQPSPKNEKEKHFDFLDQHF